MIAPERQYKVLARCYVPATVGPKPKQEWTRSYKRVTLTPDGAIYLVDALGAKNVAALLAGEGIH